MYEVRGERCDAEMRPLEGVGIGEKVEAKVECICIVRHWRSIAWVGEKYVKRIGIDGCMDGRTDEWMDDGIAIPIMCHVRGVSLSCALAGTLYYMKGIVETKECTQRDRWDEGHIIVMYIINCFFFFGFLFGDPGTAVIFAVFTSITVGVSYFP